MKSITRSDVNFLAKGKDKARGVFTRKPKDHTHYETSPM